MGIAVCAGANLQCTFGMAPSVLTVLPKARVLVEGKPLATIMDQIPFVNILPFGMCQSLANPTVAAATAAAFGVLTPMPCTPMIPGPWVPGSPSVLIGGSPCLSNNCKCQCAWGGVISIVNPGAVKEMVK